MNRNYYEKQEEKIGRNGKPQVIKTTERTDEFVNPYNFVSLKDKCNKTVDAFDNLKNGRISGIIQCTLRTLTPLFIPNTTTDKAFNFTNTVIDSRGITRTTVGKAYDFYSYEDLSNVDCENRYAKPVIPGSSIRGAVRSAFEAATNSCLSTCNDEDLILHRRTTLPKASCGILEKTPNGYDLYEAEKIMLNTAVFHGKTHSYGITVNRADYSISISGVDKKTGDTVYIQRESSVYQTSEGFKTSLFGVKAISDNPTTGTEGILFLGEKFQKKHHDAVFIKGANLGRLSDGDYERFFKVWELYQKDSPGFYPNYINLPEIPVYYGEVGSKLYITPACVSKEVFDAKFSSLLGSHAPCSTAKDRMCPACALFGLVSENTDGSLASRLMFRDAYPTEFSEINETGFSEEHPADFYEEPRQLPILETPKISATEFYTEDCRDKYKVWNYDYGIKKDGGEPEGFNPKLRGRKFYWHHNNEKLSPNNVNGDRANLTSKVRAVKKGKTFSFKISFDRLTSNELKTLLWVLTFGGRKEHAHKLGHGKPIGYGSVAYTVESVTEFKLQDDLTFTDTERDIDYSDDKITNGNISQYLKMTDYKNAPANVSYPVATKDSDPNGVVYQWFSLNKGKMSDPKFEQVLATPDEIVRDKPVLNTPMKGAFAANETPKPTIIAKKTIVRDKIRNALSNFKYNPQSRARLVNFMNIYESSPDMYKEFKDLYESVKGKLKNG